MAIMDYVTPGLTKIGFEDSLFVTTELNKDENLEVKGYIESRGGIIKNSVTKTTDYLIYKDGEEETTKYKKALELIRDKGLDIKVLSLKTFSDLLTMKKTPDVSEISIKDHRFAVSGLGKEDLSTVKKHVKKHGGTVQESVTGKTDYLIYPTPSRWNNNWETKEYAAAMSMEREDGSGITVLSFETFVRLSRNALEMEAMEFGTCLPKKGGERRPIRWIVVKKEKNRALLLSADRIGRRPYNEERKNVTWGTCTLRKWLNGDFYSDAFTEEEKKRICLTEVRNEDNPQWNTPGGNDTEDRVFLLSIREAEKWLTWIERRNGDWWWLRSPGFLPHDAAGVDGYGDIHDGGNYVSNSYGAVCPALWIDLESDIE